jgi:hypothetical protein
MLQVCVVPEIKPKQEKKGEKQLKKIRALLK